MYNFRKWRCALHVHLAKKQLVKRPILFSSSCPSVCVGVCIEHKDTGLFIFSVTTGWHFTKLYKIWYLRPHGVCECVCLLFVCVKVCVCVCVCSWVWVWVCGVRGCVRMPKQRHTRTDARDTQAYDKSQDLYCSIYMLLKKKLCPLVLFNLI